MSSGTVIVVLITSSVFSYTVLISTVGYIRFIFTKYKSLGDTHVSLLCSINCSGHLLYKSGQSKQPVEWSKRL